MNTKSIVTLAFIALIIIFGVVLIFKKGQSQKLSMTARPATYDTNVGDQQQTATDTPSNTKLFLTLSTPVNNSTYTNSNITIKGSTIPDAEVFINDISLKADKSGNFSVPLILEQGENEITIDVNDPDGNVVEKILTVTYQ